jgi:hypothetical protein
MAIALVRLPSSLAKDDKNYRGPVLFNPGTVGFLVQRHCTNIPAGGPGGSGVDWVVNFGTAFRQILGNQYDVVGFDPR